MTSLLTQLFSLITSDMADSEDHSSSTLTVLILFFSLMGLIILLIFLYKKLNRETNGEYTVQHMVYKEGGVRDQVRGATSALGTCLVQLCPHRDTDDYGAEMVEIQDEEGQMEKGDSEGSVSEEDDHKEEDNLEQCGKTEGKETDNSDDDSSLEGSEVGEQTRLIGELEAEKGEEREEKVGDGEGKGEASGGAGLLIDLKHFTGSAIWSEEEVSEVSDVTPL